MRSCNGKPGFLEMLVPKHKHTQTHRYTHAGTHTHTCFLEAEPAHTCPDPSRHGPWPGKESGRRRA